jgi:hypothetical protein
MTDFQTIVLDLRKHFGSARQVARKMDYKNPDYLGRIARGEIADPPWSVGDALIRLHGKVRDAP